jgi:hypothetical protein
MAQLRENLPTEFAALQVALHSKEQACMALGLLLTQAEAQVQQLQSKVAALELTVSGADRIQLSESEPGSDEPASDEPGSEVSCAGCWWALTQYAITRV